ncbi:TasA family protein [Aneurinibacillus sp. REN35]|uniref:TasA family protein n=1 Tax=Aneurinibacillus sp. REN35 TaxID=3237286 RepID=UPI0035288369
MGIKKKIGMAMASTALGAALIGGGTWAAFTDTEKVSNSYAAGVLDLQLNGVNGSALYQSALKNLKPGDSIEKKFSLKNGGTLSIKDVFLKVRYDGSAAGYTDGGANINGDADLGGVNTADEFASQINVKVRAGEGGLARDIYNGTLKDLNLLSQTADLTDPTPNHSLPALPVDSDPVSITLTFNENADNKYMKDEFKKIDFEFIAQQFAGTKFNDGDNIEKLNKEQTERR